ncbi:hypothetical protein [Microbacterium esteraromaticum]|uniref:hypothetical protein n=1 Tax=Microbacterium esteraromaticum TaxID=57043 RepID=UPI0019D36174|nr:hypothetical protein [Microbacterium esteraromaticum]MBN7792515.1 hypothetical protein [Microbacterium esteraromaticum]
MPWFKVDDGFHGHPKVIGLSLSAVGLWTLAGTWSAQYLTEGRVPAGMVRRFGGASEDVSELVDAALWHEVDGGYEFHDWAEYQPDAASTQAARQAKSEGGARGNHARWHKGRGVVVEGCEFCETSDMRSVSDRSSDGGSDSHANRPISESHANPPVPVPDPSFSNEKEDSSSAIADATPRPDVERLLDLLEAEVVANGGKAPARNRKNRDAMRLLLDKDGRSVDQVEAAIRWCQADEFWRANILSASKLRDKYDQLRLAAQRRPSGVNRAQERQASNLSVVARMAALDAADPPSAALGTAALGASGRQAVIA